METDLASYLVFVLLGTGATLTVGQVLYRSGRGYLEEMYPDGKVAQSVNMLLAVLFHLVVLGILGIISTIDVPVEGSAQQVVTKLGVVLLVLGMAHGGAMLALARVRDRRASQQFMDSPWDRSDLD